MPLQLCQRKWGPIWGTTQWLRDCIVSENQRRILLPLVAQARVTLALIEKVPAAHVRLGSFADPELRLFVAAAAAHSRQIRHVRRKCGKQWARTPSKIVIFGQRPLCWPYRQEWLSTNPYDHPFAVRLLPNVVPVVGFADSYPTALGCSPHDGGQESLHRAAWCWLHQPGSNRKVGTHRHASSLRLWLVLSERKNQTANCSPVYR